jgi:arsenite methyltransferase
MSDGRESDGEVLRAIVRDRYAQQALRVLQPEAATGAGGCCGGDGCCGGGAACADPITANLYAPSEVADLPAEAVAASLGCGNPTALAALRPGEVVLDLGAGGGIDVLLAARRVGPTGFAYGLDMTEEMLTLARQNAARAGATNVAFLPGQLEAIPLPDNTVDVIISNCVINLAADKDQVLREAYRVLKPGGRLAISDVVVDGPVPPALRRQVELWVGCLAGALEREDYQRKLAAAGFVGASIEPTRFYSAEEAADPALPADAALLAALADQPAAERERLSHAFFSAFVRASK